MKWFQRADFIKDLKKLEKELKLQAKDLSLCSDYELQKYFQKLKRIQKAAK